MMLRRLVSGSLADAETLFEGHFEQDPGSNLAAYDVDPHGRFVMMLKSAMNPRVLRLNTNPTAEIEEDLPCFERDLQNMVTKERG